MCFNILITKFNNNSQLEALWKQVYKKLKIQPIFSEISTVDCLIREKEYFFL